MINKNTILLPFNVKDDTPYSVPGGGGQGIPPTEEESDELLRKGWSNVPEEIEPRTGWPKDVVESFGRIRDDIASTYVIDGDVWRYTDEGKVINPGGGVQGENRPYDELFDGDWEFSPGITPLKGASKWMPPPETLVAGPPQVDRPQTGTAEELGLDPGKAGVDHTPLYATLGLQLAVKYPLMALEIIGAEGSIDEFQWEMLVRRLRENPVKFSQDFALWRAQMRMNGVRRIAGVLQNQLPDNTTRKVLANILNGTYFEEFTTGGMLKSGAGLGGGGKIVKGAGDPKGIISSTKFGNRKYWDNLPSKTQELFRQAGLTDDDAILLLSNIEGPIPRSIAAAIESPNFSDATFNFMKSETLQTLLKDLQGIDLKGIKLDQDHVAQLRAILPFYLNKKVKQFPKIRQLLLKEGVFGGNDPRNLRRFPEEIHIIKSRWWSRNIGNKGEIFFKGRRLDTYKQIETAAKDMKILMNRSDDIIDKVMGQYLLMNKKNISPVELDAILRKVDLNFGDYNLKQVRTLIQEINADDLKRSAKGLEQLLKASDDLAEIDLYKSTRQLQQDVDPTTLPKLSNVKSNKLRIEKNLKKKPRRKNPDQGELFDNQ